jgi:Leucine-rich repeat (LRR) protein
MKYLKKHKQKDGMTFKKWLEKYDIDINYLNTNYVDICLFGQNLIDLDGIEDIKNLKYLDCSNNLISKLPDLSDLVNLEVINCEDNKLEELPYLSKLTNLKMITCSHNQLKELPDLRNLTKLESLYCYDNKLTELPDLIGSEKLMNLYCYNNNLPFRCRLDNNNLEEYLEWYKREFPWMWDAKKYNL